MRPLFWLLCMLIAWPMVAEAKLESAEVTLDYVARKAEARARKPFRSPRANLPEFLKARNLDYDKYREIEFRHDRALWLSEGLPFRVEFFHPGYLYEEPIHVNEFTLTHVQPIRFVPDFFDYRSLKIAKQIPADTGYAGFRLMYPVNDAGRWDELGAFLGASYFRLLGKGQRYGQSARGLALDSGEGDRPEEFPIFTDWWLGKPHRDDEALRLYAILDSVSCVGAYSFLLRPGDNTVADIEAVLYFRDETGIKAVDSERKPLKTLGLAPLTSMFWFGKSCERRFPDYRPEVHDSDGLLIRQENGEIVWRPLNNATVMRHQAFSSPNVRGFGLMQRERDFAQYQDIFNPYHQVPSVWVEPRGRWGEGQVHLVELSTHYEGLDNIVAFWNPVQKPKPFEPYRFSYTLIWSLDVDTRVSPNQAVSTRVGVHPRDAKARQFVIDFNGPRLQALADNAPPTSVVSCSANGKITENQVFRVPQSRVWRVILKLEPAADNRDPIDLRCNLQRGSDNLSETWTYHWSPP